MEANSNVCIVHFGYTTYLTAKQNWWPYLLHNGLYIRVASKTSKNSLLQGRW